MIIRFYWSITHLTYEFLLIYNYRLQRHKKLRSMQISASDLSYRPYAADSLAFFNSILYRQYDAQELAGELGDDRTLKYLNKALMRP